MATRSKFPSFRINGDAVLLEQEDYDALALALPYAKLRLTTNGVPQIKMAGWSRWRDLDYALTGTNCARRNGDLLDLRRDNLVPARRANLTRFSS